MPSHPPRTRLALSVDPDRPGRQVGDLTLRWSDNANPLGHWPLPVICLRHGDGPSVLVLGGVHGDEFEGPAAILRIARSLRAEEVSGHVMLMPAVNLPALAASSRVSPLDGGNLNRAFPGDANGGPTAMIADYLEDVLIPRYDAVIDLHSGGKASVFAPVVLATRTDDPDLFERNLALARAFGLPTIWVSGAYNDDRSVNAAAARARVPMIAAELGGGGGAEPGGTDAAEAGIRRVLAELGVIADAPPLPAGANARVVRIESAAQNLYAPSRGLFDRCLSAGESVSAGQPAGFLHFVEEPERPALALSCPADGFVLAHTNRGLVNRGEMLLQIATDASDAIA